MSDWSGHDGTDTALRYRRMADEQLADSPTYRVLCSLIADDADVLARLDTLPRPKRQPNLLLGAVRFLGGPVDAYPAFRSFVLDGWDALAATMLARRTQTNEPRRCTALLPVLAALDGPLALLEVGASAGLCLYPDRYAYRYDDGPLLGDSAVVLDCTTSGPVPLPCRMPQVVWRRGLDLNPLDVRDDEDVRWLESLIWPEHTARFALLRKAIALAHEDPAPIDTGNLITDLAATAATAPPDATLVVYHSAVLAYLDVAARAAFRAELAALDRPAIWLANEAPGVVATGPERDGPTPFLLANNGIPLAYTAPHGQWLQWFA